jgi:transposase
MSYDREIRTLDTQIAIQLRAHHGYRAIQAIPGVGPVLGAIFVAEIGQVERFSSADKLCSWAGLTPKHRESDVKVVRGRITKQGSKLVRWAAIEAVAYMRGGPKLQRDFHRVADRRGKNKARVAVARKVLTLVYYGLRDGEIRSLRSDNQAA